MFYAHIYNKTDLLITSPDSKQFLTFFFQKNLKKKKLKSQSTITMVSSNADRTFKLKHSLLLLLIKCLTELVPYEHCVVLQV